MRKFHRVRNRRILFVQALLHNLIRAGKMETTLARAKEVRPKAERLITIAKRQDVRSLRLLLARLPKQSAEKLFYEVAPRFKERHGGYLRIVKLGRNRKRDAAPVARIEFVE